MSELTKPDLGRAQEFVWRNARVLEQRRFALLTGTGSAAAVLRALLAYRNADGGFGHALEPDGRGPTSQPLHDLTALRILAETAPERSTVDDVTDEQYPLPAREVVIEGICDHLASITLPDGGVPAVHPSMAGHPRAPWWEIPKDDNGSLLLTAALAGALYELGVSHPWLPRATEFCWQGLENLGTTHPYEVEAVVSFLDQVPDRARAEPMAERVGELVRTQRLVDLSASGDAAADAAPGYAAGEVHGPCDYAPAPDSLARRWFTDAEFDAALDALLAKQADDGGWPVSWGIWTPVTEYEWRPYVTIVALRTLAAHHRITLD